MTRVQAPARLHFGLLSLPIPDRSDDAERVFGGVGLMVDPPRVVVSAWEASFWRAEGPNAERAVGFGKQFVSSLSVECQRPFNLLVEQSPAEHAGLGCGTALGLAVAKAIAVECGLGTLSVAELAAKVGRGERSAIGVYGFDRGGLIVEGGKKPGERLAPLVGRFSFPADWRIVLSRPQVADRWHGGRERSAFARLAHNNPTDVLCRLVLTGMLPALASANLDAFGEALHEYNARAGEAFVVEQGGPYSCEAVKALIAFARKQGIHGVGQSSWGPMVFAIVENDEHAIELCEMIRRQKTIPVSQSIIARAATQGATTQ